jgi:hypothetical protein
MDLNVKYKTVKLVEYNKRKIKKKLMLYFIKIEKFTLWRTLFGESKDKPYLEEYICKTHII